MKKRICTLLLALCLTLGLLPAAAQAAGDGSGTFDTVRWTLDADGGLTVSGTGDLPDGAFAGRTDIVIDAGSISSGIAQFDEHLKSDAFLDVTRHPTIRFVGSEFKWVGDELVAVGRLGANDRPLAGHGELDRLVLTGAVVVRTVGDLDIETLRTRREILDADGLLFGDGAEPVRHAHTHADDAGFHP